MADTGPQTSKPSPCKPEPSQGVARFPSNPPFSLLFNFSNETPKSKPVARRYYTETYRATHVGSEEITLLGLRVKGYPQHIPAAPNLACPRLHTLNS